MTLCVCCGITEVNGMICHRCRDCPSNSCTVIKPTKPQLVLLKRMAKSLREVARVVEYGYKSHPSDDWKDAPSDAHVSAALRHILSINGEIDESGLDHLAHAACRILYALEVKLAARENSST